jgi:hypothetical protein
MRRHLGELSRDGAAGLSYLARMLDGMGRRKRQPSPRAKQVRPGPQYQATAEPPGLAQRSPPMSPSQVLERIRRARVVQQEAEAELAVLVDHAVSLGIGWPEIATQLGVTRQAARQHYQRRHRDSASRQDQVA